MNCEDLKQAIERGRRGKNLCVPVLTDEQTAYLLSLIVRDSAVLPDADCCTAVERGMVDPSGNFIPHGVSVGGAEFWQDKGMREATRYTYIEVAPEQAKPSSPEIPDNSTNS